MDLKIAQQMTITELVLENQKLKLDAQREAEHHDRMVGELENVYTERDKAKTELEMWHDGNILHEVHRNEFEKAERERDEAREEAERYRLEANAMMLQRDEAREALKKCREDSIRDGVSVDALVLLIRLWKSREKKYRNAVKTEWETGDKYASRRYEGESIGTRWAINDLEKLISEEEAK